VISAAERHESRPKLPIFVYVDSATLMSPSCLLVCTSSYCIDIYFRIVTCSRPRSSTNIPGPTAYLYLCSMPSICIVLYTYSHALQTRDTGSVFRFLAKFSSLCENVIYSVLQPKCNETATKLQQNCPKTATKLHQICNNNATSLLVKIYVKTINFVDRMHHVS